MGKYIFTRYHFQTTFPEPPPTWGTLLRWTIYTKTLWRTKCRVERKQFEPRHDKTNNVAVRPAKTQISLGIRPVGSESSLSAGRNLELLATHWAHSEDSGQTGRMPRLIWVFAGRTLILLVLSWGDSFVFQPKQFKWHYMYLSTGFASELFCVTP